jgi:hypothetical protein
MISSSSEESHSEHPSLDIQGSPMQDGEESKEDSALRQTLLNTLKAQKDHSDKERVLD